MPSENSAPPPDAAERGIRRRALLAGAAWSAPVLAAAIAPPVHAVSGCVDCEGYEVTQQLVKGSGAWQYRDTVSLTHCGEAVSVDGLVVVAVFDDPDDVSQTTDAHNCTTDYDADTGTLTVTGNADDVSMDFEVRFGSGNAPERTVTGVISVSVPGCAEPVINSEPFEFTVIKV